MERIKLNIQKFGDNSIEVELTAKMGELESVFNKAITSLNELQSTLTKTLQSINSLKTGISGTKTEVEKAADRTLKFKDNIKAVNISTKEVIQSTKNIGDETKKWQKYVQNFKGELSTIKNITDGLKSPLSELVNGFKNVFLKAYRFGTKFYNDFISKSIDASEELNLFNVVFDNMEENGKTTFSDLGKHATQFQNKLNEAFGTNKKETMRYQGLFQAMGESAGLNEEIAGLMSENMTKLAYDLASLYNTSETRAAESLRAGVYAG